MTETPEDEAKAAHVRKAIRSELGGATATESEGRPIVQLEHVSLAFSEPVLEDVSIAAREGQTICIVGESGTGKSTILKIILRLLQPDEGRVFVDGEDITGVSFQEALQIRQKMGMVFQGAALFDSLTVYENVAFPLREHTTMNEDEIAARVREKLQFVDLNPDQISNLLPAELSGGMRKRVGIARAIALRPKYILYDEPTTGLDPVTSAVIDDLMLRMERQLGVTGIVITHDMRSAYTVSNRIAMLYEGRVRQVGSVDEIKNTTDPVVRQFIEGRAVLAPAHAIV